MMINVFLKRERVCKYVNQIFLVERPLRVMPGEEKDLFIVFIDINNGYGGVEC